MAIPRKVNSNLAKFLQGKIYKFLMENINSVRSDSTSTSEIGSEMIAQAIAYGIALTWGSQQMVAAFNDPLAIPPIVIPPAITPGANTGAVIHSALMRSFTEI